MSYNGRQEKSYQWKRAIEEKKRRISQQLFQYGAFVFTYLQEGFIRAFFEVSGGKSPFFLYHESRFFSRLSGTRPDEKIQTNRNNKIYHQR